MPPGIVNSVSMVSESIPKSFVNCAAVRVSLRTMYNYASLIRDNCIDVVPHLDGSVLFHSLGLAPISDSMRSVVYVLIPGADGRRLIIMIPLLSGGVDESNLFPFIG